MERSKKELEQVSDDDVIDARSNDDSGDNGDEDDDDHDDDDGDNDVDDLAGCAKKREGHC